MLIIALFAIGASMWRRSAIFATLAERHRWQQMEYDFNAREITSQNFEVLPPRKIEPYQEAEERFLMRRAEFHGRLRMKYIRAAWRPWLPVGPDPAEPTHGPAPEP